MKKVYLKSWLENLLIGVEFIIIAFFATTIDSILGSTTYDIIALVLLIVMVINGIILSKYGKTIIEANK